MLVNEIIDEMLIFVSFFVFLILYLLFFGWNIKKKNTVFVSLFASFLSVWFRFIFFLYPMWSFFHIVHGTLSFLFVKESSQQQHKKRSEKKNINKNHRFHFMPVFVVVSLIFFHFNSEFHTTRSRFFVFFYFFSVFFFLLLNIFTFYNSPTYRSNSNHVYGAHIFIYFILLSHGEHILWVTHFHLFFLFSSFSFHFIFELSVSLNFINLFYFFHMVIRWSFGITI